MHLRAPQRRVHRRHQGIGQGDAAPRAGAAPALQVRPRPLEVAETAPSHGQRIPDRRRGGVEPQRVLEQGHRARVVPPRRGGPAELEEHRRRVGMEGAGPRQQRLGRVRPAGVDEDLPQPRQGRQVVRAQPQGPLEVGDGLGQPPGAPDEVPQVVGPAEVIGGEGLGVPEAALRRVEVVGGHQQLAQLAPGFAAPPRHRRHRVVSLAKLRPNRRVRAPELGQNDPQEGPLGRTGLQRHRRARSRDHVDATVPNQVDQGPARCAGDRLLSREAANRPERVAWTPRRCAGHRPGRTTCYAADTRSQHQACRHDAARQLASHAHYPSPGVSPHGSDRQPTLQVTTPHYGAGSRLPPVPSSSVSHRSTGRSVQSSSRPLGQTTRTRRTAAASPSPTSTLGSLAEA